MIFTEITASNSELPASKTKSKKSKSLQRDIALLKCTQRALEKLALQVLESGLGPREGFQVFYSATKLLKCPYFISN